MNAQLAPLTANPQGMSEIQINIHSWLDRLCISYNIIIIIVGRQARSLHIITQLVLMLQNQEAHIFTLESLSEVTCISMIWLLGKEWIVSAMFMKTLMQK